MNQPKAVSQTLVEVDGSFIKMHFETNELKQKLHTAALPYAKEGKVYDNRTYLWFISKPTYKVDEVVSYLQAVK